MQNSSKIPESNWFLPFENNAEKTESYPVEILNSVKGFSKRVRNLIDNGFSLKALAKDYSENKSVLDIHPTLKGRLLEDYHKEGKLAVRPNLDWYVDSSVEAYQESLGVDIQKFLREFSDKERTQTVLELGAGNGHFIESLRPQLPEYNIYGMSDVLYYKPESLFKNIIQKALEHEEHGREYSEEVIRQAADIMQKAIFFNMDENGVVELENGLIRKVQSDPNIIFEILKENATRISGLSHYPSDDTYFDERLGKILHKKMPIPEEVQPVLSLLSENIPTVCRDQTSIFESIEAFPFGIINSDFTKLNQLADSELDFVFGRFSTVYIKSGQPYTDFLNTIGQKLSEDGLYIDNGIRQNYGLGYRIVEAQEAAAAIDAKVYICMGNGEEGKDGREKTVPRSVVITRSAEKIDYLRRNAPDGSAFVPVGDIDPDSFPRPTDSEAQWNAQDRLPNID